MERDFAEQDSVRTTLVPKRRQTSLFGSLHQALTEQIEFSADAFYSYSEVHGQRSLMGSDGLVVTTEIPSRTTLFGGFGKLSSELNDRWQFEVGGGGSASRIAVHGVCSHPGMCGGLQITNKVSQWSTDAQLQGSLGQLPGGELKMALGTDYRESKFRNEVRDFGFFRSADRTLWAAFGEFFAPVIGHHNRVPLIHRLDASIAGRYDRYSDFSETWNPKIGVEWSPSATMEFRASYSTSFLAPLPIELVLAGSPTFVDFVPVADPSGGAGRVPMLYTGGGVGRNGLDPEEAESWSLGVTYSPSSVPGLRIDISFFDIDFRNYIASPPYRVTLLQEADVFGPLITEFASDAEAQLYIDQIVVDGGISRVGSVVGVRHASDGRQRNLASMRLKGIDILGAYRTPLASGDLSITSTATIIDSLKTSYGGAVTTDLVNTTGNPLRLRGRADVGWSNSVVALNMGLNYTDSYMNTYVPPPAKVDDHMSVDFSMSCELENLSSEFVSKRWCNKGWTIGHGVIPRGC